jgi:hypothetical protein
MQVEIDTIAAMTLAEIGEPFGTSCQAVRVALHTAQPKVAVQLFERLGPAVVDLARNDEPAATRRSEDHALKRVPVCNSACCVLEIRRTAPA